jgi:hypothetical protein
MTIEDLRGMVDYGSWAGGSILEILSGQPSSPGANPSGG